MSPAEVRDWIDNLREIKHEKPPFRAILDTIWKIQREVPSEAVEFSAVTTALRIQKGIILTKTDLIHLCKSMEQLAREVCVRDNSVELTQKPGNIVKVAESNLRDFPPEQQELAFTW